MLITFEKKGKYNPNYWSCLIWFDLNKENHVKYIRSTNQVNFMFKHTELAEIIKQHIRIEPKAKREYLKNLFEEAIERAVNDKQVFNED